MPRPVHPRRAVLAAGLGTGLAGLLAAAGCGSDPTTRPTPTSGPSGLPLPGGSPAGSPEPSDPPVAGATEAAALEAALAARATALLARTGSKAPDGRLRRILGQVRDAHLAHVAALTSPDPTDPAATPGGPSASPSVTPSPSASGRASGSPAGGSTDAAIASLIGAERAAARAHRARITGPASELVLLWTSLSAAAQSYATALDASASRGATVGGRTRLPLAPLTEVQARQQLLAQTYAAIYGYQAAVPFLSGGDQDDAFARITGYLRLRDSLRAGLVADGAQPPAADPAYQVSPRPTDDDSATALLAGIETRIQPFLGQWVRTATGADRSAALSRLLSTVTLALGLGAPLDRWPGWPSAAA